MKDRRDSLTRISHFDRNRSRIGYPRGGGSVSEAHGRIKPMEHKRDGLDEPVKKALQLGPAGVFEQDVAFSSTVFS